MDYGAMKPRTKEIVEAAHTALTSSSGRRIRWDLLEIDSVEDISFCLALTVREWPDGPCKIDIYWQCYWHSLEKRHSEVKGERYVRFRSPTISKLVDFMPPLVFDEAESTDEVLSRAARWSDYLRIPNTGEFLDGDKIMRASEAAISSGAFVIDPVKLVLMHVLLREAKDVWDYAVKIRSALTRTEDIERLDTFLSSVAKKK
jgi:hypothetical protein